MKISSPANPGSGSVPNSSEASNAAKASTTAAAKKTNRNGYRWEYCNDASLIISRKHPKFCMWMIHIMTVLFPGLKSLPRFETLCDLSSRRTRWWGWGRCQASPPRARPTRSAPRTDSPASTTTTTIWGKTTQTPFARPTASPRCKTPSPGSTSPALMRSVRWNTLHFWFKRNF